MTLGDLVIADSTAQLRAWCSGDAAFIEVSATSTDGLTDYYRQSEVMICLNSDDAALLAAWFEATAEITRKNHEHAVVDRRD